MQRDSATLLRQGLQGAKQKGIQEIRANDKYRWAGRRSGCRRELPEQPGGVRRHPFLNGDGVPEVPLPGFVVASQRGKLLLAGVPGRLIAGPAIRPVGPKAGIAVKLLGKQLGEGKPVAGADWFRRILSQVVRGLIHEGQQLPAKPFRRPGGVGTGELRRGSALAQVPAEVGRRLVEFETHAQA